MRASVNAGKNGAIPAGKMLQSLLTSNKKENALLTDEGGFMLTDEGGIMQNNESDYE